MASANAAALEEAVGQLKLEGAAELVVVKAATRAAAAQRQAKIYALKAKMAKVNVMKSSTKNARCSKKMGSAEKALQYNTLMRKAARSAANIQIKATCKAERKTVEALYSATVAKNALGEDVNELGATTTDEADCRRKFTAMKTSFACGFTSAAPAL